MKGLEGLFYLAECTIKQLVFIVFEKYVTKLNVYKKYVAPICDLSHKKFSKISTTIAVYSYKEGAVVMKDPRQQSKARFMVRFETFMQQKGYRLNTIQTYRQWVIRFIKYSHYQSEADFKVRDIEKFLGFLADEQKVRPNSQKTALNALVFLYKRFLNIAVDNLAFSRSPSARKLPVVLNQEEASAVLGQLTDTDLFIAQILYGCGLRISEALELRVQSVNCDDRTLTVFSGKGNKDRCVPIPQRLLAKLSLQVSMALSIHREDIDAGAGYVLLPGQNSQDALQNFSRSSGMQFLFPNRFRRIHPDLAIQYREPYPVSKFRRSLSCAVHNSLVAKPVSCHTFRHSYATELLRSGVDVRTVQEVLGHESVRTTEIYLHITLPSHEAVISPIDQMTESSLASG